MRLLAAALVLCGLTMGCAHPVATAGRVACDASDAIAAELATIDEGERIAATIAESEMTSEQHDLVERAAVLLESHDRSVSAQDIAILDRTVDLLSSVAVWDREDDRQCHPEDTRFSLFCALRRASEDTLGSYQHRRVALQEVRFALEEATNGRPYEHRLRDFNNDPSTTLADVHAVIAAARNEIASRLAHQRAACS